METEAAEKQKRKKPDKQAKQEKNTKTKCHILYNHEYQHVHQECPESLKY